MKLTLPSRAALAAVTISLFPPATSAHSWIEYAYKVAQNGTFVGAMGYPRGWVARNSTNPLWNDKIPQNILPPAGQPFYSGNEIINKYQFEENPQFPMLEVAPGDRIALLHLENGHTTLPQNQPKKPKNRGTIYLYGTSKPNKNEKLFDIHLKWNAAGTGGDRRGRLLGTRNYDDGQCYQPNNQPMALERANKLKDLGADPNEELACQSTVKLPEDLKPGSVYTVYWYWDWPDLNNKTINIDSTSTGKYPWAGTFMRGQKDPNGYHMNAIAKNESYSSTIDIKITEKSVQGEAFEAKEGVQYKVDQDVYSAAIKGQMGSNFQVKPSIEDGAGSGSGSGSGSGASNPSSAPSAGPANSPAKSAAPTPAVSTPAAGGGQNGQVATVTVTQIVAPPVSVSTVFVTVPAAGGGTPTSETALAPSTVIATILVTAGTADARLASTPSPSSSSKLPGGVFRDTIIPTLEPTPGLRRRTNWGFGAA